MVSSNEPIALIADIERRKRHLLVFVLVPPAPLPRRSLNSQRSRNRAHTDTSQHALHNRDSLRKRRGLHARLLDLRERQAAHQLGLLQQLRDGVEELRVVHASRKPGGFGFLADGVEEDGEFVAVLEEELLELEGLLGARGEHHEVPAGGALGRVHWEAHCGGWLWGLRNGVL
ncbi:hypothetical protein LTR01_006603 [Friedmanniomyces endolithicus]|nr:hypothetical protein LTR01_006603 [Friedmanniomyces endolithicus]